MPKSLDELLDEGDLDAIDRITFPTRQQELGSFKNHDFEEQLYNPTVWQVSDRIRKYSDSTYKYETKFKNVNPNHPVACLEYVTSASNPDVITLTLHFRNIVTALLPVELATKQFKINNPNKNLPAEIVVPNPIAFINLENETDINFIGDRMLPLYFINGQQCKYGTLYFMHEHRETIKQFGSLSYKQPILFASEVAACMYKKLRQCVSKETLTEHSEAERIKVVPQKY